MKNIVLIGMPGCGKSSVAIELARLTGKCVKDSDEEILRMFSRTPSEIITENGEAVFREMEAEVIEKLSKEDGIIISTGGGAVLRSENVAALKTNGIVIWLKRELDKLAMDGRPLSRQGELRKMYEFRAPIYKASADYCVENDKTPEDAADTIYRIVK